VIGHPNKAIRAAVFLSLVLMLAAVAGAAFRPLGKVIYEKNSRYHQIYVFRNGSVTTLVFGKRRTPTVQTQIDLKDPRKHLLEYSRLALSGLLYQPEPERILVVGLGGGMVPMELRHYFPDAVIDVVEIDPYVSKAAEQFFAFKKDARMKVHVRDGRVFIRELAREETKKKYDIIILDAFNSDYIPFHLMTREFLEQVRDVLAEDGAVVANVFYRNRLFDAELATYIDVFRKTQVYLGANSGNAMIVALGPKAELLSAKEAYEQAGALQDEHKFKFDLRQVAKCLKPNARPEKGAYVLTDDKAPVNLLRSQEKDRSSNTDADTGAGK